MLHLTVKNFGVLKDIEIELNKTNLFIGDNGSGKSTLAKLITVVTEFTLDEVGIKKRFQDFSIDFLNKECFIQFKENNEKILEIIGTKIKIFLLKHDSRDKIKRSKELVKVAKSLSNSMKELENMSINVRDDNDELKKMLFGLNNQITQFKSQYIPAERNLISLFNQSLSNMISAEIPLPKTLLEFSASYNSARNELKELDILGMQYKNENSQDRIYYEDANSLALENSSSGIQSALPLYLTLKYFATKHNNIIIEEPELNLFPKSQIETVKFMIENSGASDLSIMTHSPYILSILNVLIFAHKASNTNDILKEKISAIIPKEQQINPDEFSAYLIENGVSKSIKSESTGMIQSNVIDDISDELDDSYNELMEIYREFKSDK